MNIFVAKLSKYTTSDDLQEVFEKFGAVDSAKVIMDRETGQSKCFGFVEMPDDDEARDAISNLNDSEVDGSNIKAQEARPREDRGGGNRGGGGGYRGGGGGGYGGGGRGRY